MLKAGDHIVAGHISTEAPRACSIRSSSTSGLTFITLIPRPEQRRSALSENTRLLFLETPTNPLMEISDIRAITELSHRHGVEVVVDNTFMSPYFQRPIEFGADMVVHSTTKFLNGHSDGLGGVVVCTKPEQAEKLAFLQKCAGAILSPFECWLILRGVKTLPCAWNSTTAAAAKSPAIFQTQKSAEGFLSRIARSSAARIGQAPNVRLRLDDRLRNRIARERQQDAAQGACLLPRRISRRSRDSDFASRDHDPCRDRRRRPPKIGITDGMVRISVGIEDVDDIIADLDQALAAI